MARAKKQDNATEPAERRASGRIADKASKREDDVKQAAKAKTKKTAATAKKGKTTTTTAKKSNGKDDASNADVNGQGSSSASSKSNGQLKVGDALPTGLTLKDQAGNDVDISSLRKAVIFMYPKANTGGCTTQAKKYRDDHGQWDELGFEVYGLSNDGLTSLKNWKEKQTLPYTLLSDPDRLLIKSLTGTASKTIRSHVVIDSEGKLADVQLQVKPAESSPDALIVAKKLNEGPDEEQE
ncbi:AhpC-TSA-domain-containing protein [Jaminaea rosea]|uniref:thioredoxin-dependent peroxiredoxin n=1 Tax=Jaminaea rosea TaxID=1569628 RepID=A0A316URA4_9BASI|nr:AhpC-TSA-domain-containing protein [Jaminaea rosea]PWN27318.1 AhpC-TSA-domain-containing protein [Jaminaea rosea]